MRKQPIDAKTRRALRDARATMEATHKADCNEAETRQRVERIFEGLLDYDYIKHLSRERAIPGAGGTEHVDFAIKVDDTADAQPVILVELKRVGLDLAPKHLKQVSAYAIDCGCEWVLLTNGREWRLYHVEFGRPPQTKLVERWDLLRDDLETLASKFALISLRSVRRGDLMNLWARTEVLQPASLLRALLSQEAMRDVRRVIRRETGVSVTADDIVGALRKMLNENAGRVLQDVEVSLPPRGTTQTSAKGDRDALRKRFWETLLALARQRTALHSRISPGPHNWVSVSAGKRGLSLGYFVTEHDAGVALYIDKGKGSDAENKRIFDAMASKQAKIEAAFGEPLEWQRLDDSRACRIRKVLGRGGYADSTTWKELHPALVDSMIRFEAALREHIDRLSD